MLQETVMSIARCLVGLVIVASIGGCVSIRGGVGRVENDSRAIGAVEELALLRLAEKVEAAALSASSAFDLTSDALVSAEAEP